MRWTDIGVVYSISGNVVGGDGVDSGGRSGKNFCKSRHLETRKRRRPKRAVEQREEQHGRRRELSNSRPSIGYLYTA